ncbi:MAG TPA: hypothetical protein VK674_02755 [Candidatus Limnocylindria bacterium]|nr:hypothetical protein [Candidatus Limnocylindria bacterium]
MSFRSVAAFGAGTALAVGIGCSSEEGSSVPDSAKEICSTAFGAIRQLEGYEVFTEESDPVVSHETINPLDPGVVYLRGCVAVNPADGARLGIDPLFTEVERSDGQRGVDFALEEGARPGREAVSVLSATGEGAGLSSEYIGLPSLPAGVLLATCEDGDIPTLSLEGVTETRNPDGDVAYDAYTVQDAQFGCADPGGLIYIHE